MAQVGRDSRRQRDDRRLAGEIRARCWGILLSGSLAAIGLLFGVAGLAMPDRGSANWLIFPFVALVFGLTGAVITWSQVNEIRWLKARRDGGERGGGERTGMKGRPE